MPTFTFPDATAAVIVLGGTLLATIMRSGWRDCAITLRALGGIGRNPFDADAVRKQLARQVQQILREGLLRSSPHRTGDAEFDETTDLLITRRSLPALIAAQQGHAARRLDAASAAVATLGQAADLAPVFGLAGTLLSLAQVPAEGAGHGNYMAAIGLAVHATLYGLIAAHLLLIPLARLVERKALAEAEARQAAVDWLAGQAVLFETIPAEQRNLPPRRSAA